MWELHLRNRLLRILEGRRINKDERLTRDEWLNLALKNVWVNFHYLDLALFNRDGFKRKIEKVINRCIPPHERFPSLEYKEKENYYTTFVSYPDEKLEITDKGSRFIETGGYEQEVYKLYPGFFRPFVWIVGIILSIILSPVIWELFLRRLILHK